MTFQELFEKTGLTQAQFSEKFGIPTRTLQNYIYGERTIPQYLQPMVEEYILARVGDRITTEDKVCFRLYCHKTKTSAEKIIYDYLCSFIDDMKLCKEKDSMRIGQKKRTEVWNHYRDIRTFTEQVITRMMDETVNTLEDIFLTAYGKESYEYELFQFCEKRIEV